MSIFMRIRSVLPTVRRTVLPSIRLPQIQQTLGFTSSNPLFYDRELMSDRFEGSTKKFFIDVKEGQDGKYIKISELNSGRRYTLQILGEDVGTLCDLLEQNTGDHNVEGTHRRYSIRQNSNLGGRYTELIEEGKDGRPHRVTIPEENFHRFLQGLKDMNRFLCEENDKLA